MWGVTKVLHSQEKVYRQFLTHLEETKCVIFAPLLGHGEDKLLRADLSAWAVVLHSNINHQCFFLLSNWKMYVRKYNKALLAMMKSVSSLNWTVYHRHCRFCLWPLVCWIEPFQNVFVLYIQIKAAYFETCHKMKHDVANVSEIFDKICQI
jgi:hypothetical protein